MQPLISHSGIYQRVFIAAFALFAVQQIPAIWSTLKLRLHPEGSRNDRGSYAILQVLVLVGVVLAYQAALHFPGGTITWDRTGVFYLGIAIVVLGTVISCVSVLELGRYFTVVVAVRSDQPVIQSGLYRFVRHPSYSGQLLVFLGYGLTLTNWVSVPIVMAFVIPGYMYRVLTEEEALQEHLGAPYVDYMRRTRRLIPRVW